MADAPQVIVVHSPAGGSGKSVLALHVACLFAQKGRTTTLVDLSQYGTLLPWLHIPRGVSTGITGLIAALEEGGLADGRIRSAFVAAPGLGEKLQLVPATGPAKMDRVQAGQVETVLKHLAASADVVVVDTGSDLTDRTLGALLAATRVVLTVPPNAVAGWQVLELLDLIRSAYMSEERFSVVFTRVQKGGRYRPEEFQQVLGLPTLGMIPESPDLHHSPDRGGPLPLHGRSPGLLAIRQVAHGLLPIFTPKELGRSWLLSR